MLEEGLALSNLALSLRRHWFILTLWSVLVVISGGVHFMRQPRIFQAKTTIIVQTTTPKPLGRRIEEVDELQHTYFAEEFRRTQTRMITSPDFLKEVVSRLELGNDDDFLGLGALPPEQAAKMREAQNPVGILKGRVSVNITPESALADVLVKDPNPIRAVTIANAVAETFIEYTKQRRSTIGQEANAWLSIKVEEMRNKLYNAEQKLYEFERTHDILSVPFDDKRKILTGRIARLTNDLYDVDAKMENLRARIVTLQGDKKKSYSNLIAKAMAEESSLVNTRLLALQNATVKEEVSALKFGPQHPNYMESNAALSVQKKMLKETLGHFLMRLRNELQIAKQRKTTLERELEVGTSNALETNKLSIQYKRMQFEVQNSRELYSMLLKRNKETELTERAQFSNVQIAELAEGSGYLVSPDIKKHSFLVLIVLVVGIVGLIILFDRFERNIRNVEDAEALTGLKNMGLITPVTVLNEAPTAHAKEWERVRKRGSFAQVASQPYFFPRSNLAEDIRTLRTNVLLHQSGESSNVFMLTSSLPNEGKSVISSMLGATMAAMDQRVVLIDCDLRKPVLHGVLPNEKSRGLSDWIAGDVPLEEIIHPSFVPGLNVIPCGRIPSNPTEILHSEKMEQLVSYARENFDFVILDTPPIGLFSDAVVVATLAKRIVYIIDPEKADRRIVRSTVSKLKSLDLNVAGFVFNRVTKGQFPYGYKYSYRKYGYGYKGDDGSEDDVAGDGGALARTALAAGMGVWRPATFSALISRWITGPNFAVSRYAVLMLCFLAVGIAKFRQSDGTYQLRQVFSPSTVVSEQGLVTQSVERPDQVGTFALDTTAVDPDVVVDRETQEKNIEFSDFLPTVIEMFGLKVPKGMGGISLLGDSPGQAGPKAAAVARWARGAVDLESRINATEPDLVISNADEESL